MPALAGRPPDELVQRLRAFKSAARGGTVMPELARGYTGDELDALAAWFAARRPPR
jgi:cytochrome c553